MSSRLKWQTTLEEHLRDLPETITAAQAARFKSAIGRMRWSPKARPEQYKESCVDVLIEDFCGQGAESFFRTVDLVKESLSGGDLRPLRGLQDATDLRVALEDVFNQYYIGKIHVAVAMAEMSFRVVFTDPNYFDSDYRSAARRLKLLYVDPKRTWSAA